MPVPNLPAGFRFAGVACGLKPSGQPDLALIVCDQPCCVAGVYTQNQIVAAPVTLCRRRTPSDRFRGLVINSGNANACTGDRGMADAIAMTADLADRIGCPPEDVLVMSTGVIGVPMEMPNVSAGMEKAWRALDGGPDGFGDCAQAIRTTDRSRKVAVGQVELSIGPVRIAAIAKGAGMIAPNMATLLSAAMTDAPIDPASAQEIIARVAARSFNRVSVDGHTSTNDALLLIASGQGQSLGGDDLRTFEATLLDVCIELAKMIVADGEGASHVMAIRVRGAANNAGAETIARSVGDSNLVKSAITGGDPNWGRIVSAAGYAAVPIDVAKTSLSILDTTIFDHGEPIAFDQSVLSGRMKAAEEVAIDLTVGDGPGEAWFWASDLTVDYVRFNSEYTT